MPVEPEGKFGVRYEKHPLTAKNYHLYRDCGRIDRIPKWDGPGEGRRFQRELVELTDQMVELLGMQPCKHCLAKSVELTLKDMIMEELFAFAEDWVVQNTALGEGIEAVAERIVTRLNGMKG